MKKKCLTVLSVLCLLCALIAFAACGGVETLSFDRSNMPQTVYVLGSDLNLSKGLLNADGNSVRLDDGGVSVSGYDKNTLGEQTLTVSYGGQSIELTVTVVPRVRAAEKYVYFVGEQFADASPRLSITRDDGTAISVTASESALTLTGFDTSKPAETVTVTAKYAKGEDAYEGTFDITVAEGVPTFRAPRKTEYGNHETELDMTGASLTLKSKDGSATRSVALNQLQLSGFDPTLVSEENESVEQNISVAYRGRAYATFAIDLVYSDVSRIKKAAETFSALDWDCYRQPTASDPGLKLPDGVTDADGKLAIDLLSAYGDLSVSDSLYITRNELDSVARVAVVYAYNEWRETANEAFEGAFSISETGTAVYSCATPEDAKSVSDKIAAGTDADIARLSELSEIFHDAMIARECGDTVVYDSVVEGEKVDFTVGELAELIPEFSYLRRAAQVLGFAAEAYSLLEEIPSPASIEGWADIDLTQYYDEIEAAYTQLTQIGSNEAADGSAFRCLNGWREKKDFFEILYRYYVADYMRGEETAESSYLHINTLVGYLLPGPLEEMRTVFSNALVAYTAVQASAELYDPSTGVAPVLTESTLFMYYYREAERQSYEFLEQYSEDQTYVFLYTILFMPNLATFSSGDYGYYTLLDAGAFDDDVLGLWSQYLDLWEAYMNDDVADQVEFDTKVEKMFESFSAMRPIQQYYFLGSLYFLYSEGMPASALYPSDGMLHSLFAQFIYEYYCDKLSIDVSSEETDTAYSVFTDLLLAVESYANGDTDSFCEFMKSASAAYNGTWENADKATFDQHMSDLYEKYLGFYQKFAWEKKVDDEGNPVLDSNGNEVWTWAYQAPAMSEELEAAMKNLYIAAANASLAETFTDFNLADLTLPFFASYEQIRLLEQQILSCGDDAVIEAYYNMPYGTGSYPEPVYNVVYLAKSAYADFVQSLGIDLEGYEAATQLRAFLEKYAEFFWTGAQLKYTQIMFSGDVFTFTAQSVSEFVSDFYALSAQDRYFLMTLDAASNFIHDGIALGLTASGEGQEPLLPEAANTLLIDLLSLNITFVAYENDPDGSFEYTDPETEETSKITYREELLRMWEIVKTDRAALSEEVLTTFDSFLGGMYEHLEEVCSGLTASDAE